MRSFSNSLLILFFSILAFSCKQTAETTSGKEVKNQSPEELYGQLFYDVQSNPEIFSDSKTFVDAIPLYEVEKIQADYAELEDKSTAAIYNFVKNHFEIPQDTAFYQSDSASIEKHIPKLWEILKRPADENIPGTLIPLPNPYIVPGGRFREIYYWDSYFTMLGLKEDGQTETIQNMVDNFSYLLDIYGFIPNGNRTYYLSRSQPPFFAGMLEILSEIKGTQILIDYLPSLEKEYEFWMKGSDSLSPGQPAYKRVVLLPGGEILNRYWDDKETPRPESYREDVETAMEAVRDFPERSKEEVYRNLRAAAESGWDFSSRWLSSNQAGEFRLSTIHTTHILPVDLNSLLYNLERNISRAYDLAGNPDKAKSYKDKSEARSKAIHKYFWNSEKQFFTDHDFKKGMLTEVVSLAGVYPLYFKIADTLQARQVSEKVEELFLKPGGVVTTLNNTGQQWDAPNGWAPLQWLTISGLRNYGFDKLGADIKERWLQLNTNVYYRTYKLLEKYNVEDLSKESGGGEYPTQDGFGWTNGVYQKLYYEK